MIEKKKVIALGVSRYVGLPKDFKIEAGEKLVVIHNRLIGFATPEIADMTDEKEYLSSVYPIVEHQSKNL